MKCIKCGRKSNITNCYGERMCYECHSTFTEEQEHGQEVSGQGNDEGLVEQE